MCKVLACHKVIITNEDTILIWEEIICSDDISRPQNKADCMAEFKKLLEG